MICEVCRGGLESIWQPDSARRLGHLKDFPDVLYRHFPEAEGKDVDQFLGDYDLCEPERYVFGHHQDHDSLARSKEQGCVVCNEFSYVNDSDDINPAFEAVGYYSVFTIELLRRSSPAMLVYSGEILEQFSHDMLVHDAEDYLNPAITHSTSDAVTWSLVQEWLGACVQTHISCTNHAVEDFTPTRLLELDISGSEQVFRLIDGYSIGPSEPYVTLSHCWGSGPAKEKLRLLTTNDHILRDGLPVSSLPRLFRDAFEIVERLGIRYIWIDRLCIIQDSAEDWEAEAATMQTVYQNGFLNIAALGAHDDQDGCFFERDPRLVAPTIIDLSPPRVDGYAPPSSSSSSSLLYRFEAEDESWRSAFADEPLLGRAWVLQERILAARNLYFGRQQVFWECGEASRCETVPRGRDLVKPSMPSIPRAPQSEDGEPVRREWKSLIDAGAGRSLISWGWDSVVRRYSQCSLTFPTDKLVALSGLAKDMGSRLHGDGHGKGSEAYLAGIWRDSMPQNLLWKLKRPGTRPYLYRAPSWAWASVDGDIEFARGAVSTTSWFSEIISAWTIPRGKDVTGELAGGHIILSGPLCVARGIKPVKTSRNEREMYNIKSFHDPETGRDLDIEHRSAYICFDTLDHYEDAAVILFKGDMHKLYEDAFMEVNGLAATPVSKIPYCFRRVGFVSFRAIMPAEGDNPHSHVLNNIPVKTLEMV